MPRGLYNIDVVATFGVPLTTIGDIHMLIKCIKDGKHDELLFGMTNHDRIETLDALGAICNSNMADNTNADAVDINIMSTSYARVAGASAKDQPKVNFNFRPLVADPVFDGVNISIPRFFFFKFDSQAGLEAVLEGGPWLFRKSSIILKKWSMVTRLLKEELTRIPIWVKLHDVPIQGRSSFARYLIEVNSKADLIDIVTIGIPSLTRDGFTKETIHVEYEWRPCMCDLCKIFGHIHDYCPNKVMCHPIVTISNVVTLTVEKTNDGFQTVSKKKKRKGKSKSTNGGQFASPSVKQNVRYKPKVTTITPKKGATSMGNPSTSLSMLKTTGTSSKKDNIPTSNSYFVLNDEEDEEEEEVINVYDETAKLSIKTIGSSPFTASVGHLNMLFKGSRLSFQLLRDSVMSCAIIRFSGRRGRIIYRPEGNFQLLVEIDRR
ncbi:zinc knuckle CX2CX4HX4C containing protein [Tanacetum coccineum]|uniref:Zinc knuckle CX2CX4HX4C containing protein n=1 Tax=Tanacetum coccineum TaxID=301880 RepID=A0ABQ5H4X8_9ASTR